MEPHEIENRLRQFGEQPLPEHLSELPHGVISPMATTGLRRTARRPLVAAAAVAALVLTGGVSFAAMNSGSGPSVATSNAPPEVSELVPEEVEEVEEVELPEPAQTDEEPGEMPVTDEGDTDTTSGADSGPRVRPFEGDPCKGPPSWVTDDDENADPVDGTRRAEQAREHARIRAECRSGDDEGNARPGGRPEHAGPPEGVPGGGSPEGRPGGPPEGRPGGPSNGDG